MKQKWNVSEVAIRSRLKLSIICHCRSGIPFRVNGAEKLAKEGGVYSSPATIEQDLLVYLDQIEGRDRLRELLNWSLGLRNADPRQAQLEPPRVSRRPVDLS